MPKIEHVTLSVLKIIKCKLYKLLPNFKFSIFKEIGNNNLSANFGVYRCKFVLQGLVIHFVRI